MKKLSIMLFALVAFSLASWASVTITPQMAVNIVKQQRTSAENLKADFYASAVTSFYTDGFTPYDTLSVPNWVTDNSSKILVFVDEEPTASWSHTCQYYYIPQVVNSLNNVSVATYNGIVPPNCNIKLISQGTDTVLCGYNYSNSHPLHAPVLNQNVQGSKYHAILLADVVAKKETYYKSNTKSLNEISAMYIALTRDLGFPKSNVHILLGSSLISDGDTLMLDDAGNPIPLKRDFDGDGINEQILEASLNNYEDLCYELGDYDIDHLLVCYCGNAYQTPIQPYIFSEDFGPGEFELMYWSGAKSYSLVFSCPFSADFVTDIISDYYPLPQSSIVGVGLTNNYPVMGEQLVSNMDPAFVAWLSATVGYMINGGTFSSNNHPDIDQDGNVNLHEAFLFSRNLIPNENPIYRSYPETFGDFFCYNPQNQFLLGVNSLETYGIPESSKIWVKNTHNSSDTIHERIHVTQSQKTKHIYCNVSNHTDYNLEEGLYLNVYWKKNVVGLTNDSIFAGQHPLGGLIASIPVSYINAEDSTTYHITWTLPDSLVALAQNFGGIMPVSIVAQVSQFDSLAVPFNDAAQRNLVRFTPSSGKQVNVQYGPFPHNFLDTSIPIYLSSSVNKGRCSLVINRYANSGLNAYNTTDLGVKFTDLLWDSISTYSGMAVDNSVSNRLKLTNYQANAQKIYIPVNQVDSLLIHCRVEIEPANINDIYDNYYVQVIDSVGNVIGGTLFGVEYDGNNNIIPFPGIMMSGNPNNSVTLSAQNVTDDMQCEWQRGDCRIIGEGQSIQLNQYEAAGIVQLKVTKEDGVRYASINLDECNRFENVDFANDGSLNIILWHESQSNTQVVVTPILENALPETFYLNTQERVFNLNTTTLAQGYYVVALLQNGQMIDKIQILK